MGGFMSAPISSRILVLYWLMSPVNPLMRGNQTSRSFSNSTCRGVGGTASRSCLACRLIASRSATKNSFVSLGSIPATNKYVKCDAFMTYGSLPDEPTGNGSGLETLGGWSATRCRVLIACPIEFSVIVGKSYQHHVCAQLFTSHNIFQIWEPIHYFSEYVEKESEWRSHKQL